MTPLLIRPSSLMVAASVRAVRPQAPINAMRCRLESRPGRRPAAFCPCRQWVRPPTVAPGRRAATEAIDARARLVSGRCDGGGVRVGGARDGAEIGRHLARHLARFGAKRRFLL